MANEADNQNQKPARVHKHGFYCTKCTLPDAGDSCLAHPGVFDVDCPKINVCASLCQCAEPELKKYPDNY